jgi:hypothetical protein
MDNSTQTVARVTTLGAINSNDTTLSNLKQDLYDQQESLLKILNDVHFMEKDYDNSYLGATHNNIMLSIYTIIVVILIIAVIKINLGI